MNNSSVQNFSHLAIRAFEECSSKAELKYAAKTLGDVFESRRERIAELLDKYISEKANTSARP
jgi:hypothetical protein